MPYRFLPGGVEQAIAEAELSSLGLHIHLADDGNVASYGQLEETDDEPVELGDTYPAGVIFDRRDPIADGRLLGQQRGTAALFDEVVARRGFEFDELTGIGDLGPADHLGHRVS